jgi:hypothetical protein
MKLKQQEKAINTPAPNLKLLGSIIKKIVLIQEYQAMLQRYRKTAVKDGKFSRSKLLLPYVSPACIRSIKTLKDLKSVLCVYWRYVDKDVRAEFRKLDIMCKLCEKKPFHEYEQSALVKKLIAVYRGLIVTEGRYCVEVYDLGDGGMFWSDSEEACREIAQMTAPAAIFEVKEVDGVKHYFDVDSY